MKMRLYRKLLLILLVGILMVVSACSSGTSNQTSSSSSSSQSASTSQSTGSTSSADSGKTYELRLGTVVSPPHPWVEMGEFFAEEVSARTDGKVKMTVHHSGVLGNDETMIDEMRLGTVDFVIGGTQNAAAFIPEFQMFGFSYLFESMDHFEKAVSNDSPVFQFFKDAYDERNLDLKLLAMAGGGTRYLSNNVKEVSTPTDLSGMKMRLPGSPIESKLWSAVGALPTSLAWNEVYSAIQTGVVNAFESTLSGYTGSALYEVAPYVSLTEHLYMATHFSMSKATYDKLPEEYIKVIEEVAAEAGVLGTAKGKEFDGEILKELPSKNVTLVEIDKQAFIEVLAPLHDELAEELGASDLVRMVRELN